MTTSTRRRQGAGINQYESHQRHALSLFVWACADAHIPSKVMDSYLKALLFKYRHLKPERMSISDKSTFLYPTTHLLTSATARLKSHLLVDLDECPNLPDLYEAMLSLLLFLNEKIYKGGPRSRILRFFRNSENDIRRESVKPAYSFSDDGWGSVPQSQLWGADRLIFTYISQRASVVARVWDKCITTPPNLDEDKPTTGKGILARSISDSLQVLERDRIAALHKHKVYSELIFSPSLDHSIMLGETVYQHNCPQHPKGCACPEVEHLPLKEGYAVTTVAMGQLIIKWNPATLLEDEPSLTLESLDNLNTARRLDLT